MLDTGGGAMEFEVRRIFGWTQRRGSRLVVIGIGNMLDLTQPSLVLLGRDLTLISFSPYSEADMLAILKARILATNTSRAQVGRKAGECSSLARALPGEEGADGASGLTAAAEADKAQQPWLVSFQDAALDLCARRVAAEIGDVRKALQACRQVAFVAVQAAKLAAAAHSASPCADAAGQTPLLVRIASPQIRVLRLPF